MYSNRLVFFIAARNLSHECPAPPKSILSTPPRLDLVRCEPTSTPPLLVDRTQPALVSVGRGGGPFCPHGSLAPHHASAPMPHPRGARLPVTAPCLGRSGTLFPSQTGRLLSFLILPSHSTLVLGLLGLARAGAGRGRGSSKE